MLIKKISCLIITNVLVCKLSNSDGTLIVNPSKLRSTTSATNHLSSKTLTGSLLDCVSFLEPVIQKGK